MKSFVYIAMQRRHAGFAGAMSPREINLKKDQTMNAKANPARSTSKLDLAEMNSIASNIVKWQRRQAEAFDERPLAYIECLLDKIGEEGNVPRSDLPEEVAALVPWLKDKECANLVGVYFEGRNA